MPLDRMFDRYRTLLCGSTWLMVAMSWPLWIDDPDFPRVPFIAIAPIFPGWISWVLRVGLLVSLLLATLGWRWRVMVGVSLGLLVFAVLQDQNRLQPWVYQYLVIGVGLIGVSRRRSLGMARWYTIGLYAYSGLSKLDASFCQELGPTFLAAALRPLGLSASTWPNGLRTLAILAMPCFEILVAALLTSVKTRRVGLGGSILQHVSLVIILGPWSLGHSAIVLVWNCAQVIENLCLFEPSEIPGEVEPATWRAWPARLIFGASMVLPIGERWGLADAWPAHALYASHAERSDIFIHEDDAESLPDSIRRYLGPVNATSWRRLDLTTWSRNARGTPLYPSGRVGNAVAEFLSVRLRGQRPIRLVQWSRAGAWNGDRLRDESLGLRAIQRRADGFRFNAHPTRERDFPVR